MSIALCLVALSAGYLVFVAAVKEEDGLRFLGQTIGVAVMLIAILTSACCLWQGLGWKASAAGEKVSCSVSGPSAH